MLHIYCITVLHDILFWKVDDLGTPPPPPTPFKQLWFYAKWCKTTELSTSLHQWFPLNRKSICTYSDNVINVLKKNWLINYAKCPPPPPIHTQFQKYYNLKLKTWGWNKSSCSCKLSSNLVWGKFVFCRLSCNLNKKILQLNIFTIFTMFTAEDCVARVYWIWTDIHPFLSQIWMVNPSTALR